MSAMEGQERRADKKSSLLERLHNPTEFRLLLMAVVLGIGYVAIYMPLNKTIAATTRKLADARKAAQPGRRSRTSCENSFSRFNREFRDNGDTNEWMQYVLGGLRQSPLKLESFNPGCRKALGTYQVLCHQDQSCRDRSTIWTIHLLAGIESAAVSGGQRQDDFRSGRASGDDISMDIVVVGVMG